jgi:hypothetical protein
VALLGAANLGVLAGVSRGDIFKDLRKSLPPGKRAVTNREITEAIGRAVKDHKPAALPSNQAHVRFARTRPEPAIHDGAAILGKLIDLGEGATEADFWEASPIRLDWPPEKDAVHVLRILYRPDDSIYIGDRNTPGVMNGNIRTSAGWIDYLSHGGATAPHVIPNPLNGRPVERKTGNGPTLRGDGNVSTYRFCMVEFDNLNREAQLAFWASVNLPVSALILYFALSRARMRAFFDAS